MLSAALILAGTALSPAPPATVEKEIGRSGVINILKDLYQAPAAIGVIAPQGGTLKNQWLELRFPPGAVKQRTNVSITPLVIRNQIAGFTLQPFDLKVTKPLHLRIGKQRFDLQLNGFSSYLLLPDVKGKALLIDLRQVMEKPAPQMPR